jgi:hypothetical protein
MKKASPKWPMFDAASVIFDPFMSRPLLMTARPAVGYRISCDTRNFHDALDPDPLSPTLRAGVGSGPGKAGGGCAGRPTVPYN